MIDYLTTAYYQMVLKTKFFEADGPAFQTLFNSIMGLRYPTDYQPIKPHGKAGDRKNDGWIQSQGLMFQVYAPDNIELPKAIAKIKEDYQGAVEHWGILLKSWVFVVNDRYRGVPADIEIELTKLGVDAQGNRPVAVDLWSCQRLAHEVSLMAPSDLMRLLGQPMTAKAINAVTTGDIDEVVQYIERTDPIDDADTRPPSAEKLAYNKLGKDIEQLLRRGMGRFDAVQLFFDGHQDPQREGQVTGRFREHYRRIKAERIGAVPDQIFSELWSLAAGRDGQRQVRREAATLAVLAYLFERCHIFERPDGSAQIVGVA